MGAFRCGCCAVAFGHPQAAQALHLLMTLHITAHAKPLSNSSLHKLLQDEARLLSVPARACAVPRARVRRVSEQTHLARVFAHYR
jgi:hypothetical protein